MADQTTTPANPLATKWFALNTVLAEQMVEALDRFLESHNGFPPELTEEQWAEHLTAMRDGFRAHLRMDAGEYSDTVEYRILHAQRETGLTAFSTWFDHLWD